MFKSHSNPADCDGCYAPICLPEKGSPIPHGKACFVSGWGTTAFNGAASDKLQAVAVNVLSHEYCTEYMHDANKVIQDLELCAAVPDLDNDGLIDGGKDACQGQGLNFLDLKFW